MSVNIAKVLLTSAVRAATNSTETQFNPGARGGHIIIDMTVVPGTDTVTPSIVGVDSIDGSTYTILEGSAIVAAGKTVLKVYPGITAVANGAAPDFLPLNWKVILTHSAASDFTYSVTANINM